jgi:hypothetical protein
MRKSALLGHLLRVLAGRAGESVVPLEGRQSLLMAFTIHRVQESAFDICASFLAPAQGQQNDKQERSGDKPM